MALVRLVVSRNASQTGIVCACSGPNGAGACTVVDLGGRSCDRTVYAGVQLLSCTVGGMKLFLQANSSSGYTALNVGTDLVAWTSQACRDSQWATLAWNCASATSTDRKYFRTAWTQTCAQTNKFISGLAVEP